jgi:hypothetical protein
LKRLVSVLFATFAAAPATAQSQPTILQQLQRDGSFESIVVTPYEPFRLAALVPRADVIIEASVSTDSATFSEDGTDIYTDYTFIVRSVFKNMTNPDLTVSAPVCVRRNGGTMVVNGRAAVVRDNDFPLFERGQRYVLLLRRSRDGKFFSVLGGAQGAFALADEVRPLSLSSSEPAVAAAAFLGELRALLKFSPY